jgi:hypothetical protein
MSTRRNRHNIATRERFQTKPLKTFCFQGLLDSFASRKRLGAAREPIFGAGRIWYYSGDFRNRTIPHP